jgi:two-component system heavy metal sensor histidine kinase CusS
MGYSIMRRGMRPIEAMARTVERIHSRRLSERIATADLPSELARLAHTFNEMLDRLEGSFGRISQFSDNVAHELRTPINNLQSEIEVALSRGRTGDDYREVLASCLEECNRITRIVQGLLFLAREESSSSPILLEELDIPSELEAVKDFYEGLAADAGLHIEVDAPGALCARLDRTLLRQAISNLVSNAIEHTARGGLVRIRASRESAGIRVAVADTGEGIPAEHLPRVFERFYRVDGARSLSQRNVGLGLAIVKSIVARHGGQIGIESRPGVGTTVTIDFATAA